MRARPSHARHPARGRHSGGQAADNLFWFGRYGERRK
jgi:hypothetical protein